MTRNYEHQKDKDYSGVSIGNIFILAPSHTIPSCCHWVQ